MIIGKTWGEAEFRQDPGTAAIGIGGSLLSGSISSRGQRSAARTQANAANRASDIELQMFREGQEATAPWREAGEAALNQLSLLYGLPSMAQAPTRPDVPMRPVAPEFNNYTSARGGRPAYGARGPVGQAAYEVDQAAYDRAMAQYDQDLAAYEAEQAGREDSDLYGILAPGGFEVSYEDYEQSPGYQFQLQEMLRNAERTASARGLAGGNLSRRLGEIGQGMAAMDFQNYEDRQRNQLFDYVRGLQSLAGVGQTTATQGAQRGANVASSVGANMMSAGRATAQGQLGQANVMNNLIGQGAQLYGMQQAGYFSPPVNPSYGGAPYGLPTTSTPAGSYGLMVA